MSWTSILVIAAIAILVPTALVAAFAFTKDTHQYSAHYSKHGFTQETKEELIQMACGKEPLAEPEQASDFQHGEAEGFEQEFPAPYERPGANWPTEL